MPAGREPPGGGLVNYDNSILALTNSTLAYNTAILSGGASIISLVQ